MWSGSHGETPRSCLELYFGFNDMSKPMLPIEATAGKP